MPVSDDPTLASQLEQSAGHPGDRWDALKDRVQASVIKEFSAIEDDWLGVLFCLDSYRSQSLVPRGMGNPKIAPAKRLAGIYRNKGNWYADLIALLLSNRTSQSLAPRSRVEGFSQLHQIDVAWPDRSVKPIQDPLICLETKVTGAPRFDGTPERGAMADWTNRRKELKFAATDLKLNRRQSETTIDHWDVWRTREKPKCYFLWGARLSKGDDIGKMVREVQALTNTYLDGAGIVAWQTGPHGYEPVSVTSSSPSDRISSVDDLLRRIANEIKELAPTGAPPPPQTPKNKIANLVTLNAEAIDDISDP